jgi:hypothetical protein
MEQQLISPAHWRISRTEMLYLLNALSARDLIGVDQRILHAELDSFRGNKNSAEIEKSLIAKKILTPDKQRGHALSEEIRPVLDVLFFPQRALFTSRRRAGEGRQVICAAQKNKTIVVHAFPSKGEHSVRVIPNPDGLFEFLIAWFPFFRLPISKAEFKIPQALYNRIRSTAMAGQAKEALALLETVPLDPEEKKAFIRSLADGRLSGTMAWMQMEDGKIGRADSVAVVSDGQTGWLISQEDGPSTVDGAIFNIRRTGADLAMTVRAYVEQVADMKLPRLQTDPSGKFKRFSLTSDELAMALNAINCTDLAGKFYAENSGDPNVELYAGRMKEAQQTLIDSGLCILSEKKNPQIHEDLSQALFSIARADSMIQVTASGRGSTANTSIYLVRGRFFTSYFNHGEFLQVMEYGEFKDIGFYLESLFKDFYAVKKEKQQTYSISFDSLDKARMMEGKPGEIEELFVREKIPPGAARLLAEGFSESIFRATLLRHNPPEKEPDKENKKQKKPTAMLLLLLKSRSGSWIFEFQETSVPGKAYPADHEVFREALTRLILSKE